MRHRLGLAAESSRAAGRVVLTASWAGCLVLTLLPYLPGTPEIEFQRVGTRNLVHTLAWLLAFPGSRYWLARCASGFGRGLLRWLPRLQWGPVGLLALLPPYGWLILYSFFLAPTPSEAAYPPLLRRGAAVVSYQQNGRFAPAGGGSTAVLLEPAGPLLEWIRPVPPDLVFDSTWTLLDLRGTQLLNYRWLEKRRQRGFRQR